MKCSAHPLLIGPVGMPWPLVLDGLTQTYAPVRGGSLLRLADGAGLQQSRWRKLSTTVSGSGILPAPLAALDWDAPLTLGCIAARGVQTGGAPVTLPDTRRTDTPPFALAVVGDQLIRTPLAMVGDVATPTAMAGASSYFVYYYPLLTVTSNGPLDRWDRFTATASWDIEFEEI